MLLLRLGRIARSDVSFGQCVPNFCRKPAPTLPETVRCWRCGHASARGRSDVVKATVAAVSASQVSAPEACGSVVPKCVMLCMLVPRWETKLLSCAECCSLAAAVRQEAAVRHNITTARKP